MKKNLGVYQSEAIPLTSGGNFELMRTNKCCIRGTNSWPPTIGVTATQQTAAAVHTMNALPLATSAPRHWSSDGPMVALLYSPARHDATCSELQIQRYAHAAFSIASGIIDDLTFAA